MEIRVRTNLEALLADIGPEHTDTNDSPNADRYNQLRGLQPDELASQFADFAPGLIAKEILLSDGVALPLTFAGAEIPVVGDQELARDSIFVLTGNLAKSENELIWRWPARYGSSVIRFGEKEGTIQSEWLQSGEQSQPYKPLTPDAGGSRIWQTALNYLVIGFEHIVPKGLDHILFVVGIFLLSTKLSSLLLQVTAFTVAHTITLGLSIFGLIAVPESIVEPLIALSIAYVGIENCISSQLKPWRVLLVFLFGLLHGMGFAGVLGEIGLPESDYVTALITFNIGVEFGQLAVIAGCFLLVGWWRNKDWYRARVVIPVSLLISCIGLYWTWERTLG